MKCPHTAAQFCPLYVASHIGDGSGCDDGRLEEGGCAVSRGMNYAAEVGRVRSADPTMVANLVFAEVGSEIRAQRARNLRVNGIR